MSPHPIKDEWVKVIVVEPGQVSTQRARLLYTADFDGALTELIGPHRTIVPVDPTLVDDHPELKDCVVVYTDDNDSATRPGGNPTADLLGAAAAVGRAVIVHYPDNVIPWDTPPGALGKVFSIISGHLGVV